MPDTGTPRLRRAADMKVNSSPTVAIACSHRHLPRLDGETASVVVDVIRSTTTAVTAAAAGRCVVPVHSVAAAQRAMARLVAPILAGETHGVKPHGFDLQNSPSQVAALLPSIRPVVLLSSSGTGLMLEAARRDSGTYATCLRNATAQAEHLAATGRNVLILGVDRYGELRPEDRLCAARIATRLLEHGYRPIDRLTRGVIAQFGTAPDHVLLRSRSANYLRETGQEEDLAFILDHVEDLELVLRIHERTRLPTSALAEQP